MPLYNIDVAGVREASCITLRNMSEALDLAKVVSGGDAFELYEYKPMLEANETNHWRLIAHKTVDKLCTGVLCICNET